jgi:hypothetical protein
MNVIFADSGSGEYFDQFEFKYDETFQSDAEAF